MSHLIQVHLVRLLPRIQELPPSLLLQRHHHHIVTPETQHTLGSGFFKRMLRLGVLGCTLISILLRVR